MRTAGARGGRPARHSLVLLAVAVTIVPLVVSRVQVRAAARPEGAALVPVVPCRLLDTRRGAPPAAGAVVHVQAAGVCGVPEAASGVVVTLTATGPAGPGFVTAWNGDGDPPGVSNLNVAAGETRANTVVVTLADGTFALVPSAAMHLVVDVAGAFVPAETSRAGRFVPMAPTRVTDTRTTGELEAGATVRVPLPDGVPADATALAVTLTTAEAAPGYFTATPAGAPRLETSVLNTDASGQTRAVGAILPVSPDGLDVFTSAGAPVIVDVSGYFTGRRHRPVATGCTWRSPPSGCSTRAGPHRSTPTGRCWSPAGAAPPRSSTSR